MQNGILKREIAEDMAALDKIEPKKDCQSVVSVMVTAIKRSLRVAETAYGVSKQIRWMLAILIILSVKQDVWSFVLWIARSFSK